jgi:hypothetical protein
MTALEILKSVHFVVDQDGTPTAAVLDMRAWEAFLSMLEDLEDESLVVERLKNWRSKEGWSRWEEFEGELEPDELPGVD